MAPIGHFKFQKPPTAIKQLIYRLVHGIQKIQRAARQKDIPSVYDLLDRMATEQLALKSCDSEFSVWILTPEPASQTTFHCRIEQKTLGHDVHHVRSLRDDLSPRASGPGAVPSPEAHGP